MLKLVLKIKLSDMHWIAMAEEGIQKQSLADTVSIRGEECLPAKWLFASHEGPLASKLDEAATILTSILDVPGANIGWHTDYPNRGSSCFFQSLQIIAENKLGNDRLFPHAFPLNIH
jgi:hypothetical protein